MARWFGTASQALQSVAMTFVAIVGDACGAVTDMHRADRAAHMICPACGGIIRLGSDALWMMMGAALFVASRREELEHDGCGRCGWKPGVTHEREMN